MGWSDAHLHEFVTAAGVRFAANDPEIDPDGRGPDVHEAQDVRLRDVLPFVAPFTLTSKSHGHPDHDPLWAKAQALDVPIAIHPMPEPGPVTRGNRFRDLGNDARWYYNVLARQGIQQAFYSLFQYGVFDKFPRLKVVVLEAGAGWIGASLDRMDAVYQAMPATKKTTVLPLKEKPSVYFRRQCWISADPDERAVAQIIEPVGADRWGAPALIAAVTGFVLVAMIVILPLAGSRVPSAVLPAGEALALAAAIASPLLLRGTPVGRGALMLAAAAALGTLVLLLGNPAVSKNLALWSFGLAGYFPAIAYAAAAASLVYTAVVAHQNGRSALAAGVALFMLGGVGLHSTYQTALVVAALALRGFLIGVVNDVTNLGAFADLVPGTITGGTVAIDLFTTPANAENARAAEREAFLEFHDMPGETVRILESPDGFPWLFQRVISVADSDVDFVVSSAQLPVGSMLATVNVFGFISANGVTGGLSVAQEGLDDLAGGLALAVAELANSLSLAIADGFRETSLNPGFAFTAALGQFESGDVIAGYDGSVESVFAFDNGTGAFGIPFTGRVPFTTQSLFEPGGVIIVNGSGGVLTQPRPGGAATIGIGPGGGFAGWQGGPAAPADFFAANACVAGAIGFNTATGAFDQSYIRGLGAPSWPSFSPGQAFWVNSACPGGFTLDLPGPPDLSATLPDAGALNGILGGALVATSLDGAASSGLFAGLPSVLGSATRAYHDTTRSPVAAIAQGASFIAAIRVTSVAGATPDWGDGVGLPLLTGGVGGTFDRSGAGQVAVIPNDDGRVYEIAVTDGSILQRIRIVEIGDTPVVTDETIAALIELALQQIAGP